MLYTLKKRSDFVEISKSGNSIAAKGVVVLAMKRKNIPTSLLDKNIVRVGYTVTKKVGNAVVRNRIKRRFRAIANSIMPQLAMSGYDYVFIARYHSVDRTFSSLEKDISYALHSLRKNYDEEKTTSKST